MLCNQSLIAARSDRALLLANDCCTSVKAGTYGSSCPRGASNGVYRDLQPYQRLHPPEARDSRRTNTKHEPNPKRCVQA